MSEVRVLVEKSVGVPFDELFESFEPLPVGAASIAQAHRATLRDGTQVSQNIVERGRG
jgi:predicted unusual protein kinase regulating ubiquinone biosynthesis (AarF/ABC1/UbiB family)